MATSGVIAGTKVKTLWLTFEWKRTAVDIVKNTSTIQWSLKLNSSSSLVFSADKTYTLSIDDESYNGTFSSNINWGASGGSAVIKSGTITIPHGANGKKTFDVVARFNVAVNISGTQVTSLPLSGSQILADIPRATTPTLQPSTDLKMGDSVEIVLNRASASFTHDLSYTFGKTSGMIADGIGTGTTWNIPRTLANQIPAATSGTCTITCKTYDGTKLIGTKQIKVALSINNADVPTIKEVTFAETVSGIAERFGAFIQSQSKIKVSVTASGVYGSTIASYEVKVLGLLYSKQEFVFDALEGGQIPVQVTVTDSRGKTATMTSSVTVESYVTPTVEMFEVKRCDSSGVENPQEGYMTARIKFNISPLHNLNDKSFKIEYQEQGASEWTTLLSGNEYSYDSSYVHNAEIFESTKVYSVRLTLSDYFKISTYTADVGTSFFLLFWDKTGTGLSIGDAQALANLFSVALETRFRSKVTFDDVSGIPQFADSGWIDLPLKTGWSYQYTTDKPQYRKIGNIVYLRGLVDAAESAQATIAELPIGFRPIGSFNRFACALNQKDFANVQVGRNGLITDYTKTTSTSRTFLCLNGISFFAD